MAMAAGASDYLTVEYHSRELPAFPSDDEGATGGSGVLVHHGGHGGRSSHEVMVVPHGRRRRRASWTSMETRRACSSSSCSLSSPSPRLRLMAATAACAGPRPPTTRPPRSPSTVPLPCVFQMTRLFLWNLIHLSVSAELRSRVVRGTAPWSRPSTAACSPQPAPSCTGAASAAAPASR
jgi:hypothetical protein